MQETQIIQEESDNNNNIKVYKYRWIILCIFCVAAAINFSQYLQYSIISNIITKYYNVDSSMVSLTGSVFSISFLILFIPFSYIIDKFGMRISLSLATGLTTAGNLLKLLSLEPDRFYVAILAQTLVGMGEVIIISLPSKVACLWFDAKEVSTACAVAVLGTQLGVAIGCIIPTLIVEDNDDLTVIKDELFLMFTCYAVVTFISFVSTILFFRAKPLLPPTLSQINLEQNQVPILKSFKEVVKNKHYLILLAAFGVSNGIWNSFGILFNDLYLHYFPGSEQEAGIVALLAVISGGCFGSLIFGFLLDKFHKFRLTTFLALFISASLFAVSIAIFENQIKFATYLSIPLFGLFLGGSMVISFEYSVEVTFPIPEETSCSLMNGSIFLFALIFTYVLQALKSAIGYLYTNITVCLVLYICSFSIYFVNSKLRRRDANIQQQQYT